MEITRTDKIIFALFACWCLVDSINGFLIRSGFLSISQIYKIIVSIIVISRCYNYTLLKITGLLLYLGIYAVHVYIHDENIGSSIVLISKLLTSLIFYWYFREICDSNDDFFKQMAFVVIKWNFIIYAVNMLFGFIGIGFTAYDGEGGLGGIGFFYAANELSGFVAAVFPWVLYHYKTCYSMKNYVLCGAVLLLFSYTMSAKAGIMATIMSFFLIAFFYGDKKERRVFILVMVLLIVYVVYHIQDVLGINLAVMQRFSYLLDQNGLTEAITSNRLGYWEEYRSKYINSDFTSLILGLGGNRTVEMDPYDALLNCGLLGFMFLVYLYINAVVMPIKCKHIPQSKVILSSNIIIIIISTVGGHILFSSMAGMLIALSNALLFVNKDTGVICGEPNFKEEQITISFNQE